MGSRVGGNESPDSLKVWEEWDEIPERTESETDLSEDE